jgi:hypothetical protein
VVRDQDCGEATRAASPRARARLWQQAQGFRFGTTGERQQQTDARSRAYQAYDNNPVARTLVRPRRDNVIGDGLNYQPTTDSKEWNREAKDRYYQWLENAGPRPDVDTGCELQRMLWSRRASPATSGGSSSTATTSTRVDSRIQVCRRRTSSRRTGCTPTGGLRRHPLRPVGQADRVLRDEQDERDRQADVHVPIPRATSFTSRT